MESTQEALLLSPARATFHNMKASLSGLRSLGPAYARDGPIYKGMEAGDGALLSVGLLQPGQQGYDPVVELSIARDNRDFGVPRRFKLGKMGQYWTRVNSRRWGRMKQGNLKIRMTDPVPFEITAGAMRTSMRAGRGGPTTRSG